MPTLLQKYTSQLPSFEKLVSKFLIDLNVEYSKLEIDHLGMKFVDQADVDELLKELLDTGAVQAESIVMKGRIFRIIKLATPIIFLGKEVWGIELPDIKQNAVRKRIGFEHLEFYFDKDIATEEEVEKYFYELFPNFEKTFIYSIENNKVENQLPNPTLVLENKEEEFEVKFHPRSIFDVIKN